MVAADDADHVVFDVLAQLEALYLTASRYQKAMT
jgi:hypothetical protein